MPEGPELFLSSLYINRTCEGLVFSGPVVKNPIHKCQDIAWTAPAYTISAESKGKELMLHLRSCPTKVNGNKSSLSKECSIIFTFGMSGKFEFTAADSMPKHSHLIFHTKSEPKMGLAFVDYRRFGKWVEGGSWSEERGPCVIQDHGSFVSNVAANLNNCAFNKPICEVLLNQKFFNGIGNYLRAEILFRCNVPPFERARSVLNLKEPKPEPAAEDKEQCLPLVDIKAVKIEDHPENRPVDVKKTRGGEISKTTPILSNGIKVELPEPVNSCEIDLFTPKAQELLKLCNTVPLEVIDIGSTKYSLSELYKDDSEGKSFNDWLQCYYQEGMKNMADHNKRTIWYAGPPGPMAPKEQKVRGKKKTKANKVSKESRNEVDAQISSMDQSGDVETVSPSSRLTRTKLKEYKSKRKTRGKSESGKTSPTHNGMPKESTRKRKKEVVQDDSSTLKKVKTNKVTRSSKRARKSLLKIVH